MKSGFKYIFLTLVTCTLLSCGREILIPQYQPVTVNQLINNQAVKFSYHLDDTPIEEYGKGAGKFPIFGKLFKAIAQSVANSKIGQSGGYEMDPPSVLVDTGSLLKVDFNNIDQISLDRLDVIIRDSKSKDSLKFIDKVEIFALLKRVHNGLPVNEEGYTRILYFDRTVNNLGCDDKCLVLVAEDVNWKKLLQENPTTVIKSKIIVNSVPESTMKLAGSVEFSVKFNVGF